MNLIGVARYGIGVAGVPPVGVAIARGLAMELIRHAEPWALAVQAAGQDTELDWLRRVPGVLRRAPRPPGVAFAIRVANGTTLIGSVLVAEREADLGERIRSVLRIGLESIELDRRDGAPPLRVVPRFVGREVAAAWARSLPRAA